MAVYYNEWDPFMAQWLRNLIKAGHLPPGDVDERDIREIGPDDLKGYTQHHFFAGVGGWSESLALAGWSADRPVWTGSCPCQPFSVAGKGLGEKDERHLWPAWFQLIRECKPAMMFGEQVASPLGREWLSGVRTDLEAVGYAVGAADLCAAGVGSPQIRQRLWWVADSGSQRLEEWQIEPAREKRQAIKRGGDDGGLRNASSAGRGPAREPDKEISQPEEVKRPTGSGDVSRISHAQQLGRRGRGDGDLQREGGPLQTEGPSDVSGLRNPEGERRREAGRDSTRPSIRATGTNYWSDFDVLPFADGKARRVEPGTFPLAHGVPNRVGRLRGYGNAINPQTAAVFIRACREIIE